MPQNLADLTATALLAGFRAGDLSPVDAAKACLDRIAALNPALNAFCLIDAPRALADAKASERRWERGLPCGPLDGVPVSIKDLVLTAGWPTRRGSLAVAVDQPWDEDAPAVARLRRAGAVLIGKTTTPEMGHKGVTDSPLTGITRNPWDPRLTPGGSSGGAAVAAATGMAPLNLGTDGGGSIRIPASFSGVVGLKPSMGRVAAWPPSPFGTLAHLGPLTRSVADAALMLAAMSGPDPRDWMSAAEDDGPPLDQPSASVDGMRIAFAPTLNGEKVAPEVASLVRRAADRFAELGARVSEVKLDLPDTRRIFQIHWTVGAAALLAGFPAAKRGVMDPGLVASAALAGEVSAVDYALAQQARAKLAAMMATFHADYDLLLLPTMPIVAFEAGRNHPGESHGLPWVDWTPFTYPFNLTGQPACSVPCGLTRKGLPVGLQLVGPLRGDRLVLRAAAAFEAAYPFPRPAAQDIAAS